MYEIRQSTVADLPYIYEICWKTGYRGQSVEGILEDRYQIGHYFAAPYLHYDKECCFVATENGIPKGYILGTSDTVNYTKWLNKEWLPQVRKLYDFSGEEASDPFAKFIRKCIADDTVVERSLYEYPAHLHIDLLPDLQGKGMGRKLMEVFFKRCLQKGATRVHLGVGKKNPKAVAFYKKMGMFVISESDSAYMMGLNLI